MCGKIDSPSISHAAALFVVHIRITVTTQFSQTQTDIHAVTVAILVIVESQDLLSLGPLIAQIVRLNLQNSTAKMSKC
jgi:hypothetical protein